MVAYSFRSRFSQPILAGTKRQTIRADRKRHARPGEILQIYTGMRTRSCRLIGTATCHNVMPVRLRFGLLPRVTIGEVDTFDLPVMLDEFARKDGFTA